MSTIKVENVVKKFGEITAVNDVSLTIKTGQIHGLIGPNGSGKTTLLNLLSGYYKVDQGSIFLNGEAINTASVQKRSKLGLARTFQKPRLLPKLTTLDNAMLGAWNSTSSGFLSTLFSTPSTVKENAAIKELATEILLGVGLGRVLNERAEMLDHAEQRFLEIARALCMQPNFILLDEPAGGLTEHEIEQLSGIVTTLCDLGIGILIVEHHTDFVFRIAHEVTTLHLGQCLASGAPDLVRNDPEVIRVYLGA